MKNTMMIIPKTITVGYQTRNDTYTGKLAYVIYTDNKGKLRKETSWQSWRDNKLGRDEYENEPTSGFVLNRGVGGARQSYGWNVRNEYVRVYDPRGFEFEISVSNLLFILQECSAIKGKGLEGEFVYSWNGTELVLLPVDASEYKECVKFTDRQTKKVTKGDIKEGYTYIMKNNEEVMYLGRHLFNDTYYNETNYKPSGKKHIFCMLKEPEYGNKYIAESGFTKIAEVLSNAPAANFADEYETFLKSKYYCNVKNISFSKISVNGNSNREVLVLKENDKYYHCNLEYDSNCNYYNYSYNYVYNKHVMKYTLLKSNKEIEFNSKTGELFLHKTTDSLGSFTNTEINQKFDIYQIDAVTVKGKKLKVTRY